MKKQARKYRRKSKFVRAYKRNNQKGIRNKILRGGFLDTAESSNILDARHCVTVGHSSFVMDYAERAVFYALVKMMLRKVGIEPQLQNQAIAYTQLGDIWRLTIRRSIDSSPNPLPAFISPQNIDYTAGGPNYGWDTIADSLRSAYKSAIQATGYNGAEALFMEFIPAAGSKLKYQRVFLHNLKITMYCKNSLKIQNRTKAPGNEDNTDVVGRVPMYGKSYEGKGTGCTVAGGTYSVDYGVANQPFNANRIDGMIAETTDLDGWKEPLPPGVFNGVKKHGKISVSPGQIKTSVLTDVITMTIGQWLNVFQGQYDGTNSGRWPIRKVGKFRFFMLEKMLEVYKVTDGEPNINVAYEHNIVCGAVVTSLGLQGIMRPWIGFREGGTGKVGSV